MTSLLPVHRHPCFPVTGILLVSSYPELLLPKWLLCYRHSVSTDLKCVNSSKWQAVGQRSMFHHGLKTTACHVLLGCDPQHNWGSWRINDSDLIKFNKYQARIKMMVSSVFEKNVQTHTLARAYAKVYIYTYTCIHLCHPHSQITYKTFQKQKYKMWKQIPFENMAKSIWVNHSQVSICKTRQHH